MVAPRVEGQYRVLRKYGVAIEKSGLIEFSASPWMICAARTIEPGQLTKIEPLERRPETICENAATFARHSG